MDVRKYQNIDQITQLMYEVLESKEGKISIIELAKELSIETKSLEQVIQLIQYIQSQPRLIWKKPGEENSFSHRIWLEIAELPQHPIHQNSVVGSMYRSSLQLVQEIFAILLKERKLFTLKILITATKMKKNDLIRRLNYIQIVQTFYKKLIVEDQSIRSDFEATLLFLHILINKNIRNTFR